MRCAVAVLLAACAPSENVLVPDDPQQSRLVMPSQADATYVGGPGTGWRADGLGDLDGDGAEEVGVAEIYATVDGRIGAGRVQLLLGDPTAPYAPVKGPAWYGTDENEWLGVDALAVGDTDGDGDPELLLGGLGFWLAEDPLKGGPIGASALGFPGDNAAVLADLDGDGKDDLALQRGVIGDPSQVAVWLGPPTAREPDLVVRGALEDQFGFALAAGDLDGDGLEELAAGAPFAADDDGGAVFLYGVDDLQNGRPYAVITGTAAQRAGTAVQVPGDVDGDGLADLLVGAFAHDGEGNCATLTQPVAGALFPGPVASGAVDGARARFTWDGPGCARLGEPLGDLDGDGTAEIAFRTDPASWIFLDAPSGAVPLRRSELRVEGPVGCCTLGDADVDGDGARDLIVGRVAPDDVYAQPGDVWFVLGPLIR